MLPKLYTTILVRWVIVCCYVSFRGEVEWEAFLLMIFLFHSNWDDGPENWAGASFAFLFEKKHRESCWKLSLKFCLKRHRSNDAKWKSARGDLSSNWAFFVFFSPLDNLHRCHSRGHSYRFQMVGTLIGCARCIENIIILTRLTFHSLVNLIIQLNSVND